MGGQVRGLRAAGHALLTEASGQGGLSHREEGVVLLGRTDGDPDPVASERSHDETGRFAGAQGQAALTGGFTGIPGDFFFDFEGTLKLAGD